MADTSTAKLESLAHAIGGLYQGVTRAVNNELTLNWYPQAGSQLQATKPALVGRPSLQPFVQLPSAPIRALFSQDNRTFGVSGPFFCEIFRNQTYVVRGTMLVDVNPSTISCNGLAQGHQVMVTSGGHVYIYDLNTNAFTDVTTADLVPAPVAGGSFLAGYFFLWQTQSPTFSFSAPFDGTNWTLAGGAGTAQMQLTSDNIANGFAIGGQQYFVGTKNIEIWGNTGASDITFAPVVSAVPRWGCQAPYSLVGLDNTLFWLGQNEDGGFHVCKLDGYNAQVISNPSISRLIQTGNLTSAQGFAYAQDGHAFYELYVPGLQTDVGSISLVYDVASGLWHGRSITDPVTGLQMPDLAVNHCWAFNAVHLVGDRQSGCVYQYDQSQFQDTVFLA